ncbi:hypothetical protein MXAN_0487 [Myxococcus xanthus DK 1622]|uniref:Uncharacterized protein n=1 Tax=Myxococcus xanthus (strain DK1622) TaxID=246197 RepID=Q1DF16_MYXXD|nr:hypothetical protein MXAN_0487 [Myxococcus xanthus DK 1622]
MMKEERLRPLVVRCSELLHRHPVFLEVLGFISGDDSGSGPA